MTSDVPRGTSWFLVSLLATTTALSFATLVWGEWVHAVAALRQQHSLAVPTDGTGVVLVLGFRNRGTRINTVNRWRASIALRTAKCAGRAGAEVTILCSGGAVGGPVAEATLLAEELRRGGWTDATLIEDQSHSTWENIRNSTPHLQGSDWISVASNGLHAEKARCYLAKQRPDLAKRLVAARDYRPGERLLLKPLFAAVGLWKLRSVRRT